MEERRILKEKSFQILGNILRQKSFDPPEKTERLLPKIAENRWNQFQTIQKLLDLSSKVKQKKIQPKSI